MKLSIRFILPLVLTLSVLAYLVVPLVENFTLQWFLKDLDLRTQLITNTIQDPLDELLDNKEWKKVVPLFERLARDERLLALGLCESGKLNFKTKNFPPSILCSSREQEGFYDLPQGPVHVSFRPVGNLGEATHEVVFVHDMSFIKRRSDATKKYILFFFLGLTIIVSFITVLIAQLSWRGWVMGIRSLLKGDSIFSLLTQRHSPEFKPIAKDLRLLIRDLERDRRIRDELSSSWTPASLKNILQKELAGDEVLILSNREPYIHQKNGDRIEVQVPASGLVTALEPIMRACSGTWIAHGSGSADKDVVDEHDRIAVPPENPSYRIRRVWLTKEEEEGYYYGFSNEGLWPLCHIAHTRPIFRSKDWEEYRRVNLKFAKAVVEEAKTDNPVILIQDYHFALAPKMIKDMLPRATIITFWHIPWPNPESFGICPWREEILEGLLGSTILGFHTWYHCNNFLETTDRFLESRIDKENATISFGKKITAIQAYPISIEWPTRWLSGMPSCLECRLKVRTNNQLASQVKIGIGVDRLDYTKGILERFLAIEKLFELYPEWIGRFTFIQIAAPTRSAISEYQNFHQEVKALADKINTRYSSEGYRPIQLLLQHHGPQEVFEYFRGSDLCFVSSLHDGMNLVAKEFVASRDDEQGVLILSQFTGASRELPESIVVNPYDIDQCAEALALALSMPVTEQKERMRNMRALVQEYNVFRWAGRMLIDAAKFRQQSRILNKYNKVVS